MLALFILELRVNIDILLKLVQVDFRGVYSGLLKCLFFGLACLLHASHPQYLTQCSESASGSFIESFIIFLRDSCHFINLFCI